MSILPSGRIVVINQQIGYPLNPDKNNYTRDPSDPSVFLPYTGNHKVSNSITFTQPLPTEIKI